MVDYPIKKKEIFNSHVNTYQRVTIFHSPESCGHLGMISLIISHDCRLRSQGLVVITKMVGGSREYSVKNPCYWSYTIHKCILYPFYPITLWQTFT